MLHFKGLICPKPCSDGGRPKPFQSSGRLKVDDADAQAPPLPADGSVWDAFTATGPAGGGACLGYTPSL